MNVAYHLKKLGLDAALVTRVGEDSNGQGLVRLMEANQITTEFFQVDFELDTGTVCAMVGKDHEVTYDFPRPVAWDNIQWEEGFVPLLARAAYFVFGSLASRSRISRETLYRMLEAAPRRVFDINLRPPQYEQSTLERLMTNLYLLKLNLAELELITGWFAPYRNASDRVRVLQDRFKIPNIVVTRGGEGALLNHDGIFYDYPGFSVKVADTIGAGDAFLAGLLSQLGNGADPPKVLEFASAMGAFVASRAGPCPDYNVSDVYQLISTNF